MHAPAHEASWRQDIGGRWAVSWQGFVVLALAGLALLAANGPGSFANWVIMGAASTAAMGAVFAVAHVTVLRHRRVRPAPVSWVVATGVAAGLARGVVVAALAADLGAELLRSGPFAVTASVLVLAVATPGLALVFARAARARARHAALEVRLAALREREMDRDQLTTAITHAAYAEAIAALEDARRGLTAPVGEMTTEDRLAVAAQLRATVDDTLRPLSRRLHGALRDDPPPRGVLGIPWAGIRSFPIMPITSGLVLAVITLPMAVNPVSAVMVGFVAWVVLAGVVAVARRYAWAASHRVVLAMGIMVMVGAALGVGSRAATGNPAGWQVALATAVVAPLVVLLVSAAGSVVRGEREATALLLQQVREREVEARAADRDIARATRDLAQYVHGTMQSRLLSIAFAVEQAARAGDDREFRDALRAARAALDDLPPPSAPAPDLRAALDGIADVWRGFVDVVVTIDPTAAQLSRAAVADVARVGEEAVSNAHKHGGARRVWIGVAVADGCVTVQVTDDGTGPSAGVPGMGAAWLDFVAPDSWTLSHGAGGSGAELVAVLPLGARQGSVDGAVA